jgi:hypothetical protein
MTPEQMNIAIAEACGIASHDHIGPIFKTSLGLVRDCPDYSGDLNAMREAGGALNWDERKAMHRHLCAISRSRPDFKQRPDIMETVWFVMSEATAAQRAEAFCRTVPSKQDPKLTIWGYHERSKQ